MLTTISLSYLDFILILLSILAGFWFGRELFDFAYLFDYGGLKSNIKNWWSPDTSTEPDAVPAPWAWVQDDIDKHNNIVEYVRQQQILNLALAYATNEFLSDMLENRGKHGEKAAYDLTQKIRETHNYSELYRTSGCMQMSAKEFEGGYEIDKLTESIRKHNKYCLALVALIVASRLVGALNAQLVVASAKQRRKEQLKTFGFTA